MNFQIHNNLAVVDLDDLQTAQSVLRSLGESGTSYELAKHSQSLSEFLKDRAQSVEIATAVESVLIECRMHGYGSSRVTADRIVGIVLGTSTEVPKKPWEHFAVGSPDASQTTQQILSQNPQDEVQIGYFYSQGCLLDTYCIVTNDDLELVRELLEQEKTEPVGLRIFKTLDEIRNDPQLSEGVASVSIQIARLQEDLATARKRNPSSASVTDVHYEGRVYPPGFWTNEMKEHALELYAERRAWGSKPDLERAIRAAAKHNLEENLTNTNRSSTAL